MLFSKRITEELKNAKYSQKEIAQILHISESNISNWKRGQNLPSVDILYRLCVLLEISADYILGLEDESGAKIYNNYGTHNGDVKF